MSSNCHLSKAALPSASLLQLAQEAQPNDEAAVTRADHVSLRKP